MRMWTKGVNAKVTEWEKAEMVRPKSTGLSLPDLRSLNLRSVKATLSRNIHLSS